MAASTLNSGVYVRRVLLICLPPFWFMLSLLSYLFVHQNGAGSHRLRHTLATRLLNAGMEITRIQKLLGHDNLNTTMIYAQVLDKTLEADYRQAMQKIEHQQLSLSTTPEVVTNWLIPETIAHSDPIEVTTAEIDNFV